MSTHKVLETNLLNAYRKIREEHVPTWAVHKIVSGNTDELVVPTIPFVGKHYAEQAKKILVYASAENLANYCCGADTNRPWLDQDELAENRHRKCFDGEILPQKQKTSVIPYVHLGPMETGLLLTAAMHVAFKLGAIELDGVTPRDFCECICFANYGKYSMETEYQKNMRERNEATGKADNYDYPTKEPKYLKDVHAFVQQDLAILQPDYIILPNGIYTNDREFVDAIKGNATLISIHQMLASNVHRHIAPNNRYKKYLETELHPAVRSAYNEMTTVSKDKYLYVFGYLDDKVEELLEA